MALLKLSSPPFMTIRLSARRSGFKKKRNVCDKWKQADIYAVCPASLQASVQAEHS